MPKIVLIVEDDFLIAMDLKSMLEVHGWNVLGPAATAESALKLLNAEIPTVAILDVNLKDGSVTPVAVALRTLGVPFVLASAYDRPELVGGDVLVGAPNVGKPTTEQRLLQVLHQMRVD